MELARDYLRREPTRYRLLRLALGPASMCLLGPGAGGATWILLRAARTAGPDAAERWAIGTGAGVALAGCALTLLWERAARRRYGEALVLDDGASFQVGPRVIPPRHFAHGELELDEVTDHGALLARRGAGRLERWWRPWLVPTADAATAEALVARVSEWTRREPGASLRLRAPALQRLVARAVGVGWVVGVFAAVGALADYVLGRGLAADLQMGGALLVWLVATVDLLSFTSILACGVELHPGSIAWLRERRDLASVHLELDADGWLIVRDRPGAPGLAVAALGAARNARLKDALGERLAVVEQRLLRPARRRHLHRALLLAGAATALLAAWALS